MAPAPSITFSIRDKTDDLQFERAAFWDSPNTVQWFKEHGYTLYKRFYMDGEPVTSDMVPALPVEDVGNGEYPFAYYDTEVVNEYGVPLRSHVPTGNVAFAQDSLGRHVAIKIVENNSDEYRILGFLSQQSLEELKENCIIPVLELLSIDGFCFAVMPRWGTFVAFPKIHKTRDALHFIHSTLKALAFLHGRNICHGDIKGSNMLVNHFSDEGFLDNIDRRHELRSRGSIFYAVFDFDYSTMLPHGLDRTMYRLPYYRSWGSFNPTMDTAQGELDFNPFVLDVGSLGVMLSVRFQRFTRSLPLLAPLLDKMTTRHLHDRFTASEALQFFEEMRSQLTADEIAGDFIPEQGNSLDQYLYFEYDKWKHVPPKFATKWASYREPPVPWTTKILRRLCENTWVYYTVVYIRWFFFQLASCRRRLYTSFVG
ncbi:hypothetical protein GALMADRAFT_237664 [Galerina marginata CBS 339.88]|uniref:Protein kinase domain-containing protein n=1 Tax=Galerina marginata (strain CBS 339.88) TaxID=685588 RepID=A0A067TTT6_GALM3|nr:hypothetical protein GALMADRAFT_237664 [Galerina marginata CBS 339.88]